MRISNIAQPDKNSTVRGVGLKASEYHGLGLSERVLWTARKGSWGIRFYLDFTANPLFGVPDVRGGV